MIEKLVKKIDYGISEVYFNHIYKSLPLKLRNITSSYVIFIKNFVLHRFEQFIPNIYIYQGKNKKDGSKLRLLFFGVDASFKFLSDEFIAEKFFEEMPVKKKIGRVFVCNISKIIKKHKCDVVIVKTDRFFKRWLQKKGYLVIPEAIDMELDISFPLEDILKNFDRSAKDDVNKIKKYNLTFETSSNPKKIDYFFNNIFSPYTREKHKRIIIPGSSYYYEIRSIFENGKILLIKNKDEYIAGTHIYNTSPEKNKMTTITGIGVKLEKNYKFCGAGSSIFYFFILWAKKQGFTRIDFRATPPFLNNGIYSFKRKWGCEIKKSKQITRVYAIKVNDKNNNPAIFDFLENNPSLYFDNNRLNGLILLNHALNDVEIKRKYKRKYNLGMSKLSVVTKDEIYDIFKNLINSKQKKVEQKNHD